MPVEDSTLPPLGGPAEKCVDTTHDGNNGTDVERLCKCITSSIGLGREEGRGRKEEGGGREREEEGRGRRKGEGGGREREEEGRRRRKGEGGGRREGEGGGSKKEHFDIGLLHSLVVCKRYLQIQ